MSNLIPCYKCRVEFEPSKEEIKKFAESDRDFDPTDWECPRCKNDPYRDMPECDDPGWLPRSYVYPNN